MLLVYLLLAAALVEVTQCALVPPIVIKGKHFVDSSTGNRFQMKGVDYQPGGSASYSGLADPLSNAKQCARDIFVMKTLGVNTVRVYTVNPALDHSECMTLLAAANMYLVLDVNSPLIGESLNRYEPWTTYTPEYLQHVFEVVDEFSRYNNTLGFFIGNEIVNDLRSAQVAPTYIRAVVRDVKDYIYRQCPRQIPVGYSAADDLKYRRELPHFLGCGLKRTAIDFYGVNSYQWCGRQTLKTSGYDVLIHDYQNFDFPIFLSEFGCNDIKPRIFQEVEAIFSQPMNVVFDGGLAYEYSQEANDYGLVDILSNGDVLWRADFEALRQHYANVDSIAECPVDVSLTLLCNNSTRTSVTFACKSEYRHLSGSTASLPKTFGTDMIKNGVPKSANSIVSFRPQVLAKVKEIPYRILDSQGNEVEYRGICTADDLLRWNTLEKISYTHNSKGQNESPAVGEDWEFHETGDQDAIQYTFQEVDNEGALTMDTDSDQDTDASTGNVESVKGHHATKVEAKQLAENGSRSAYSASYPLHVTVLGIVLLELFM